MKRNLVMLIIFIPLNLAAQSVEPVTVLFKNGGMEKGTVVKNNEQHLTIKLINGKLLSYDKSSIYKIQPSYRARNASPVLTGRHEGVILGLNLSRPCSTMGYSYAENIKGTANLSIGAIVFMPYKQKTSFQGEIHLLRKGFTFREEHTTLYDTHQYTETFLQVPLMINYNLLPKPKIAIIAGPSIGFMIKTSYCALLGDNALEAGIHLGLQYIGEIKNNMHVIARIKWENSLFRHSQRINALSLGVGVLF